MARTPTAAELNLILIGHGLADFVTGGKLTRAERDIVWKLFKVMLKSSFRMAPAVAAPIVQSAAFPYAAGTALGLGALQTQPGQQLLETVSDVGRRDRIELEQLMTDIEIGVGKKVKRTKSKFNSAVSKGMKAIKNSTSYGKKGIINAPKKAFKAVVGMAAKLNKGVKPGHRMPVKPKTKTLKVIYNSMIGLFK